MDITVDQCVSEMADQVLKDITGANNTDCPVVVPEEESVCEDSEADPDFIPQYEDISSPEPAEAQIPLRKGNKVKKSRDEWNRAKDKKTRNHGETYITKSGKEVNKRLVAKFECNCKFKCSEY